MTLFELFFDLDEMLCAKYNGLTPFQLRREKIGEVALLVRRINAKAFREKGYKPNDSVIKKPNGDVIIRRRATNDDWY